MTAYQFLILLKPEANLEQVDRHGLRRLMYAHFERQDVEVLNQAEFTGALLRRRQLLDFIYPRLAVIAQMGDHALTTAERDVLRQKTPGAVNLSADRACAEFQQSSRQLCAEGDLSRVIKVGPGAYAAHIIERNCVVLNHFFPEFRDRFYDDDAKVIALECQTTSLDLHTVRERLVGDIQPRRAKLGSLRASALAHSAKLGLGEVSVARNFFHISPGYIEAMYQLAHLFPEKGSFYERLVRCGAVLTIKQIEALASRAKLVNILAEVEQLPLRSALRGLEGLIDERPQ